MSCGEGTRIGAGASAGTREPTGLPPLGLHEDASTVRLTAAMCRRPSSGRPGLSASTIVAANAPLLRRRVE